MSSRPYSVRIRPWGIEAYFRFRRKQYSKTFDHGTDEKQIEDWAITRKAEALDERPAAGTFAADVELFLATYTPIKGRRRKTFRALFDHWLPIFGKKSRTEITEDKIRSWMLAWQAAGASNSAIKKRRSALCSLWKALDGIDAPCPARKVRPKEFPEPRPQPREIPTSILSRAFDRMRPSRTKARLLTARWTGITPGELMRIKPWDVDRALRIVKVKAAGKTKLPREVPLNDDALAAFDLMTETDAWGKYSTSAAYKSLVYTHLRALGIDGIRPYDLRHTFATQLRRTGTDLADVQVLLGHTTPTTTARYAHVVTEKLHTAVQRIAS